MSGGVAARTVQGPAGGEAGPSCFLCDLPAGREVWRENGFSARECPGCHMLLAWPPPVEERFDPTDDIHIEEFYSLSAPFKARWVARRCPPGRLLEIGSGEGPFLAAARRLGYEVVGLEPHPARARRCRERHGIEVVEGLLEDHPLPTAGFDVVFHIDLLAHLADPVDGLRRMVALLAPGGVLCFEVGVLAGISRSWYPRIHSLGLGPHRQLFSRRSLDLLFARAGLEVVDRQWFGCGPWHLLGRGGGWVRRLADSVGRGTEAAEPGTSPGVVRLHQRWRTFLRYRVGALTPGLGPQTGLVVARPADGG